MKAAMIKTSGFPKSGTHALVKAVQLLGIPCDVEHIQYAGPIGKHLFIKRDPRNIVCSWLRFKGNAVTPGTFISAFRSFESMPLVDEMATYEGWLTDPETLVVSYEALTADDAEIKRIAEFVGVPYISGAFACLPGLTRTWFSDHSDYRAIWTPEVETVWAAEGGPALIARWGY